MTPSETGLRPCLRTSQIRTDEQAKPIKKASNMTVSIHKMIDALRTETYHDYGGLMTLDADRKAFILKAAEQAECFDFGNLALETLDEGTSKPPELTADEISFWGEGLIPLPAPYTWFEFILPTTTERSAFLVLPDKEMFRIDFVDGKCHCNGVSIICEDDRLRTFKISTESPRVFQGLESFLRSEAAGYRLMVYMALMLNSKSTEIIRAIAPHRLNKSRAKSKKSPLRDHAVVTIVPAKFISQSYGEASELRKPPRLHWRRSHLRLVNKGSVNEHNIVIPRCLVGKKELGEISHEYRVRTSMKLYRSIIEGTH